MDDGKSHSPPKLRLVSGGSQERRHLPDPRARDWQVLEIDWSILMARSQSGDAVAYRKLLMGITPYVRNLAWRRLTRQTDAEDALQDVLVAIHMLRATYDARRPFGPWLKTIANRKIVDRARSISRQRNREADFTDDLLDLAAPSEPSDGFEGVADVEHYISQLSDAEAEAIRMTKLQGLSLEQASIRSGQSIGAIKIATYRALRKLRQLLSKEEHHED